MGITLFGIQLTDLASNHKEVLLNPYNFKIPSSDEYHVEVFVIAKDKKASDLSVVDHGASNIILTRKDSDRVRTLAVVAQALQSLASMNEQKKRSNSNYLASISEIAVDLFFLSISLKAFLRSSSTASVIFFLTSE